MPYEGIIINKVSNRQKLPKCNKYCFIRNRIDGNSRLTSNMTKVKFTLVEAIETQGCISTLSSTSAVDANW
jgi:hypothetical protein